MDTLTQADPSASNARAGDFACRLCSAPLETTFVDLGVSTLCQSQSRLNQHDKAKPFCPLYLNVCDRRFLVQLPDFVTPDPIFAKCAY